METRVEVVVADEHKEKLDALCVHRAVYPHVIVQEAFERGLTSMPMRGQEPDACTVFSDWLMEHRGYSKRSASTTSSAVRSALRQSLTKAELDEWPQRGVNPASRQTPLNRWYEFCAASGQDPLDLTIPEPELG